MSAAVDAKRARLRCEAAAPLLALARGPAQLEAVLR